MSMECIPEAEDIVTLSGLLEFAVARCPDAPMVRDAGGNWTYAELSQASTGAANWLRAKGVQPGDRVLVQALSSRHFLALLYGSAHIGATFVPLSPAMTPYQLAHVVADAEPRLSISDGPPDVISATVSCYDLAEVAAALNADSQRAADPAAFQTNADAERYPALLIYTSGSTSMPKAVVCPHRQILFAVRAIARCLRYRSDDIVFCRLPLSFDYGLYQVFLCTLAMAELVLVGPEADARLLSVARRCGATVVPLLPSLATMLLKHARRDPAPTRIRLFTNTGEELTLDLISQLRQKFPGAGVQLMFGTTECKRISILTVDGDLDRPGSVGRPLPGTEVHIVDEDGRALPAGAVGEIVVRGPHVMAGYWRAPELSARTFRPDPNTGERTLHTDDYGHLDEDGYLYFAGRRDHLFKRNGVRTSTIEIEAAARSIPEVAEAILLPPSAARDAVLCVVTALAPTEVLRQLRARLEPAKVPSVCRVMDSFPRSQNGKTDRIRIAALVAELAQGRMQGDEPHGTP